MCKKIRVTVHRILWYAFLVNTIHMTVTVAGFETGPLLWVPSYSVRWRFGPYTAYCPTAQAESSLNGTILDDCSSQELLVTRIADTKSCWSQVLPIAWGADHKDCGHDVGAARRRFLGFGRRLSLRRRTPKPGGRRPRRKSRGEHSTHGTDHDLDRPDPNLPL